MVSHYYKRICEAKKSMDVSIVMNLKDVPSRKTEKIPSQKGRN